MILCLSTTLLHSAMLRLPRMRSAPLPCCCLTGPECSSSSGACGLRDLMCTGRWNQARRHGDSWFARWSWRHSLLLAFLHQVSRMCRKLNKFPRNCGFHDMHNDAKFWDFLRHVPRQGKEQSQECHTLILHIISICTIFICIHSISTIHNTLRIIENILFRYFKLAYNRGGW